MKYVLGVDFGGGASKATLLSLRGEIVFTATKEYATDSLENGGREQNPEDWLKAALYNVNEILKKSGVNAADVECLCFDAATHTAVLLDENFNVVRPSVYWTDTRCVKEKAFLKKEYGDEIFSKFKHEVDTVWTLPELLWVKNNEPETFSKVKRIVFAKDYVRRFFTDDFVTDYIEAEGSMFFDYDKRAWDKKFLNLLELSEENLPRVVSPSDVCLLYTF